MLPSVLHSRTAFSSHNIVHLPQLLQLLQFTARRFLKHTERPQVTRDWHRPTLPAPYSRKTYNKDPNPELSTAHLIALDSDAAINDAWARRAGVLSYLPRSARVGGHHNHILHQHRPGPMA